MASSESNLTPAIAGQERFQRRDTWQRALWGRTGFDCKASGRSLERRICVKRTGAAGHAVRTSRL